MGRPRHPDRPERWFGATTVVAMAVAASCRGRRPDVEGGVAPPLRLDTASAAAAATVPVGLPADGGVGLDASPGGGYWVVASAIGATSAILTAEVDQDRLPPAYGGQPGAVSAERRIDGGWSNEDVNDRWEARPRGWRDTVEVRANPDSDETYRVAVDFSRAHLPGGVVYSTPIRLHAPEAPTAPPTPARDLPRAPRLSLCRRVELDLEPGRLERALRIRGDPAARRRLTRKAEQRERIAVSRSRGNRPTRPAGGHDPWPVAGYTLRVRGSSLQSARGVSARGPR